MIISVDATSVSSKKTGTTVYVQEILTGWNKDKNIAHNFIIFISEDCVEIFENLNLDGRFKIFIVKGGRIRRSIWVQIALPIFLLYNSVDVHWSSAFVLPILFWGKAVVTIHDVTFISHPQYHEIIKRLLYPFLITMAIWKAHTVLCVSETTQNDLIVYFPKFTKKYKTIHLAARGMQSHSNDSPHYKNQKNIVLTVGTLEPRKNLVNLILAWNNVYSSYKKGLELHIVGMQGWMKKKTLSDLVRGKADIKFLGHLTDCELSCIYQKAILFIYISHYEGFGLPVIEAMSNGVPVITSNVGATKEIAQDAAILVNPNDINEISDAINVALSSKNKREELISFGKIRSASFCWQKTSSLTLAEIILASKDNF